MDDKTLKDRIALRKAILTAAEKMEENPSIYCGHRTADDIKYMGRGNAFAWIQNVFGQQNPGRVLTPYTSRDSNCVSLDSQQFYRDMEEFNQGKEFISCGGKRYPLWTRSAKQAADNLRKYAAKHFADVDAELARIEQEKVLKIAQQKQALQIGQDKVKAFLPEGKKDNLPIKL